MMMFIKKHFKTVKLVISVSYCFAQLTLYSTVSQDCSSQMMKSD